MIGMDILEFRKNPVRNIPYPVNARFQSWKYVIFKLEILISGKFRGDFYPRISPKTPGLNEIHEIPDFLEIWYQNLQKNAQPAP